MNTYSNYTLMDKHYTKEDHMSVLSEIFGECPQVKIVETFAENYNEKLYVADIVRMTDISKITVNNHINKLLEEGIIEKKEKAGKIQFYQLNIDNPKAKIILLLEQFIVSERLEKLILEDIEQEEMDESKIYRRAQEVTREEKDSTIDFDDSLNSQKNTFKDSDDGLDNTKMDCLTPLLLYRETREQPPTP